MWQFPLKSLWLLCLLSMSGVVHVCWGSSNNAGVERSLKCLMPNNTVTWEAGPEMKTVDVEWKYGPNHTCYTPTECFGVRNDTRNGTRSIGVQLRPVQLQYGNKLRFILKRYVNTTYPHIYKVNATEFHSCNVSQGKIVRKDNGSDVFELPSEFLDFGNNYFIVATNYSVFASCDLGLRLNVTVKTEKCTGNASGVCGGRGLCVTNRYRDNFACHCCGTYKGENCSIFDACLSSPCQNGGECLHGNNNSTSKKNSSAAYQCKCALGFNGTHCEHKVQNLCEQFKCQNGGTCTGNATSFHCTCMPGWTGSQCEVDVNDCESTPCRHGHCVDQLNGYNCSCYPGYYGDRCQFERTSCKFSPCQIAAVCYYGDRCQFERTSCKFSPCQNAAFCENQTTSHVFKYACHCTPGWNGTDCSTRDAGLSRKVLSAPCQNAAFCENQTTSSHVFKYACHCTPVWNGTDCSTRVSPCLNVTCANKGMCMEMYDSFRCVCQPGFTGHRCEVNINDCQPNPCLNGGQCYDLEQGHLCRCVSSRYGDNCQYAIPASGYSPSLEGFVTHVIVVHDDSNAYKTLTLVAALVGAGVFLVVLLLAGYYYRTTESYRRNCGFLPAVFRGGKQPSDLTVQVNVQNTADCPLTSPDAFLRGGTNKLDLGVENKAFQNEQLV